MLTTSTTQTRHPWRATARTAFAAIVGILPFVPAIIGEFGLGSVPWVAGALGAIAAATRVLAIPGVEVWMKSYVPWLAAAPVREDMKGKVSP
jgi:hypothetical protein